MIDITTSNRILSRIGIALAAGTDRSAGAARCMEIIHSALDHYDWVGIYWLRGGQLELGPFVGEPTEHTIIPVGRGVCGTAVAQGTNQVIADVRELDNYLACSIQVRAEIVVLIRTDQGEILGQIDADGHRAGAFDQSDEALLQEVADRIAALPPEEDC